MTPQTPLLISPGPFIIYINLEVPDEISARHFYILNPFYYFYCYYD